MTLDDPSRRCAIAVMAKAPRPGAVKTRLVPPLSFEHAAQLSGAFLSDITENIRRAADQVPIAGYVAYAPAGVEAMFDGTLAPGSRLLLADGAAVVEPHIQGFGRCLFQTIRDLLGLGYQSAVVLNSDSPTLPTALLCETARALSRPEAGMVLGPADDGGYYLLGVRAPHAHLFKQIDWSTDQVAAQTRARAHDLGLDSVLLDPWYDVDDRHGLDRLIRDIGEWRAGRRHHPYAAPRTAACLSRLGLLAEATANSAEGIA
jgi:rSAM/selenodomain-associated transferase 1